jgi:hypothetical protein
MSVYGVGRHEPTKKLWCWFFKRTDTKDPFSKKKLSSPDRSRPCRYSCRAGSRPSPHPDPCSRRQIHTCHRQVAITTIDNVMEEAVGLKQSRAEPHHQPPPRVVLQGTTSCRAASHHLARRWPPPRDAPPCAREGEGKEKGKGGHGTRASTLER